MRRSLARATAACTAHALAFALGAVVVQATADEELPANAGGTDSAGEGPRGPVEFDDASDSARSGAGRTEAESTSWTYVDRAFPDRAYDGVETASVGVGHLEWDRAYTRRALFRFPVGSDPDGLVESAVLRADAVWSYDCRGDSELQLHRVDPFDTGATWNDQPAARELLDTRSVSGGRASCPVDAGVEFDATEAYRWAVEQGRSHVHLSLREGDESESAAWRRFDVQDDPPVLRVDRGEPEVRAEDATRDAGAVTDGGHPVAPEPSRGTEDHSLRAGEIGEVRVQNPVLGGPRRGGGELLRSHRGGRGGEPTASDDRRRRGEDTLPRARGPPLATARGDSGFSPGVAPVRAQRTGRSRSVGVGRTVHGAPQWGGGPEAAGEPCHRRNGHVAGWPIAVAARSEPKREAYVPPKSDVAGAGYRRALRREAEAARTRLCAWAPHGRVPGRLRCAGSTPPHGPATAPVPAAPGTPGRARRAARAGGGAPRRSRPEIVAPSVPYVALGVCHGATVVGPHVDTAPRCRHPVPRMASGGAWVVCCALVFLLRTAPPPLRSVSRPVKPARRSHHPA